MEACAKINRTPPGYDDDVGNLCRSMYVRLVWPEHGCVRAVIGAGEGEMEWRSGLPSDSVYITSRAGRGHKV